MAKFTWVNKFVFFTDSSLISIDDINGNGVLSVFPIDRDVLEQEVFQFEIRAYKCENSSSFIQSETIFIIEDINDHYPEIEISPKTLFFPENKILTVPFEKFIVSDVDLGIHATYNVSIRSSGISEYNTAFILIPNSGYQNSSFILSVGNETPLDFEDDDWREFELEVM